MTKRATYALQILRNNAIMIDSLLSKQERKMFKNESLVAYLEKAVRDYGKDVN